MICESYMYENCMALSVLDTRSYQSILSNITVKYSNRTIIVNGSSLNFYKPFSIDHDYNSINLLYIDSSMAIILSLLGYVELLTN